MSPVSAKPCRSTTAGPCPPTRTCSVTPLIEIRSILKEAGKGSTAATADGLPQMVRIARRKTKTATTDRTPDVRLLGAKLHIVDLLAHVPSATTSAVHSSSSAIHQSTPYYLMARYVRAFGPFVKQLSAYPITPPRLISSFP